MEYVVSFAAVNCGPLRVGLATEAAPSHGIETDRAVKAARTSDDKAKLLRISSCLVRGVEVGEMSVYAKAIDMPDPTGTRQSDSLFTCPCDEPTPEAALPYND